MVTLYSIKMRHWNLATQSQNPIRHIIRFHLYYINSWKCLTHGVERRIPVPALRVERAHCEVCLDAALLVQHAGVHSLPGG